MLSHRTSYEGTVKAKELTERFRAFSRELQEHQRLWGSSLSSSCGWLTESCANMKLFSTSAGIWSDAGGSRPIHQPICTESSHRGITADMGHLRLIYNRRSPTSRGLPGVTKRGLSRLNSSSRSVTFRSVCPRQHLSRTRAKRSTMITPSESPRLPRGIRDKRDSIKRTDAW